MSPTAAFEQLGWGVALVSGLAALAGVAGLPGRYLAPVLAERISAPVVHAMLSAVMGVSAFLIVGGRSGWQLGAHFVLFGLVFGAVVPMRAVVMSAWFSGPAYCRIMGAQWTGVAVTAAAAPAAVGAVRDLAGSYDGPMAGVGVVLLAAVFLTVAAGRAHTEPPG